MGGQPPHDIGNTRALILAPVFYGLINEPLAEFHHAFGSYSTVITLPLTCGPHILGKGCATGCGITEPSKTVYGSYRFIAYFSDDEDGVTEGQEEESHEDEDDAAAHVNHTHSVSEATEATVQATTPLLLGDDCAAKTLSTPEIPGTVLS